MIRRAGACRRPGLILVVCVAGSSAAAAPVVEDLQVWASVRQKTLTVNVRIAGVTATGRARVTGQVTDAAGQPVLSLNADQPVSATPAQVIQMAVTWRDARPWAPDTPVLYRLAVHAAGEGWTAARESRFGFRELTVRGREFALNGKALRLRGLAPEAGAGFEADAVRRAAAAGYNALVFTASAPGDGVLAAADEAGIAVACPFALPGGAADHPSVVLWIAGGPDDASPAFAHPARLGRSASAFIASTAEAIARIRAADPTRPVAAPGGAGDADVVVPPLARVAAQEREEWLSAWGHDGTRPLLMVVAPDPEAAVARRMLRAWRLSGPVSVALRPAGDEWPAAPPAHDGWIAGPADESAARDHLFHTGERVRKTIVVQNDGPEALPYMMRWTLEIGRTAVIGGGHGEMIPPGTTQTFPAEGTLPASVFGFPSGRMALDLSVGATRFVEDVPLRVLPRPESAKAGLRAFVVDPEGATSAWVRALGWTLAPWTGQPQPGTLLIIGRRALDKRAAPGSLAAFVAAGGRLLVMAQSPARLRRAGFEVAPTVERRMWPVPARTDLPLLAAVDGEMLRDWRGFGTLVPDVTSAAGDPATWRWGNRGSVCSAPVVTPRDSGWSPIIEGGPDRSCAALLELRHGKGLAVLCTLDLEGRVGVEPAVNHLAVRLMEHLRTAVILRKPVAATAADLRLLEFGTGAGRPGRTPRL